MNKALHIRLTPLRLFYFGGERSFGFGDARNYLVSSRRWPQHTTILGAIRYLMLAQKGWLSQPGEKRSNTDDIAKLIGPRSFHLGNLSPETLQNPADFGVIKGFSPIYLHDGTDFYLPAPMDHGYSLASVSGVQTWYGNQVQTARRLEKPDQDGKIQPYDPKEELKDLLMNLCTGEACPPTGHDKKEDDVFMAVDQVGIEKGDRHGTKEQAFYKQTFLRLKKGWAFSFFLRLTEGADWRQLLPEQTILPVGGEKLPFRWEATEVDMTWDSLPAYPRQSTGSMVLLSDSYVEPDVLKACDFALTRSIDFRFMRSVVNETTHFHNLSKEAGHRGQMTRSDKFTLLKKGSVLYPTAGSEETITKAFDQPRFRQIGYNFLSPLSSNQSNHPSS